jgi:hypothetical protein
MPLSSKHSSSLLPSWIQQMLEARRFSDDGGERAPVSLDMDEEARLALLLLRKDDDENRRDASDDVEERRLDEADDVVAMEEDRRRAGKVSS